MNVKHAAVSICLLLGVSIAFSDSARDYPDFCGDTNLRAGPESTGMSPLNVEGDEYWWGGFRNPIPHPGANATITSLATYRGDLILGGNFTEVGDGGANHIARWDGSRWRTLGTGVDGSVKALMVWNDLLIVAGDFDKAGGIDAGSIAFWDGTHWDAFAGGVTGDISALAEYDGLLVAAGRFSRAGGIPVNNIAIWNGESWSALGEGTGSQIFGLCTYRDCLIATGSFSTAGGVPASCIAAWNGIDWSPLGPGLGASHEHSRGYALVESNERLYVGGAFKQAGGIVANNVAQWDGTSWNAVGSGFNLRVTELSIIHGAVHAGGTFTRAGEAVARRVARWNGQEWVGLGNGLDGSVLAMTEYEERLIAAGEFETLGDQPIGYVAQWDGITWSQLGELPPAGAGVESYICALVQYEGDLVVAGRVENVGGVPIQGVARWNNSHWQSLGEGLRGTTWCLTVHEGDLYAGGVYVSQDNTYHHVAHWNGQAWDFPTGIGPPLQGHVYALVSFNGDLIAGGGRGLVPRGPNSNCIAKWDGTRWSLLGGGINFTPAGGS